MEGTTSIRYTAAAVYEPNHEDEILLKNDDVIVILHEYNDGWVLARNESANGIVGLLPKNFLVPIKASDSSSNNEKVVEKQVKSPAEQVSNDAQEKRLELLRASKRYSVVPPPMQTFMDSKSTSAVATVEKETPVSLLEATDRLACVNEVHKSRMAKPSYIGAYKLAIAGDSGIGKSSFVSRMSTLPYILEKERTARQLDASIIEISTSTNIDSHGNKYNLQFIDTPGFGLHMDAYIVIEPIISYLKQNFRSTNAFFNTDVPKQLIKSSLISYNEQVTVMVYGILHRLKPVDKEFLKKLAPCVCIVPVIVKSDTLDIDEVYKLKTSILQGLKEIGVSVFSFGLSVNECITLAEHKVGGAIPFAISNMEHFSKWDNSRINEFDVLTENLLLKFGSELKINASEKFMALRENELQKQQHTRKSSLSNLQKQQRSPSVLPEYKKPFENASNPFTYPPTRIPVSPTHEDYESTSNNYTSTPKYLPPPIKSGPPSTDLPLPPLSPSGSSFSDGRPSSIPGSIHSVTPTSGTGGRLTPTSVNGMTPTGRITPTSKQGERSGSIIIEMTSARKGSYDYSSATFPMPPQKSTEKQLSGKFRFFKSKK